MSIARRAFIRKLASASGGVMLTPSLSGLVACSDAGGKIGDPRTGRPGTPSSPFIKPYGELVRSVDCPELEIPERFRCVRISLGGVESSVREGFQVPNAFDGMAAFPCPTATSA